MTSACQMIDLGLIEYVEAWELQRQLAAEVASDDSVGYLLLLEHPHVYTIGRSGKRSNVILDGASSSYLTVPVLSVDRGGDVTYHGPGQLVGYPILNLRRLRYGPVDYVRSIEETLILTLADYGIAAGRVAGRAGVWIGSDKIAAIGVRLARGVTTHGFALNVDPDLAYFGGIIPCGLTDAGVTSMARLLDQPVAMSDVKRTVADHFSRVFDLEIIAGGLPAAPSGATAVAAVECGEKQRWRLPGTAGIPPRRGTPLTPA